MHVISYPGFLSQEKQVNLMLAALKRLKASLVDSGSPKLASARFLGIGYRERQREKESERERAIYHL